MNFLDKLPFKNNKEQLATQNLLRINSIHEILNTIEFDKMDLYSEIEKSEFLPASFVAFVDKNFEHIGSKDLIANYITTELEKNTINDSKTEEMLVILEVFTAQLQRYIQTHQKTIPDRRPQKEKTKDFLKTQLQELGEKNSVIEFKKFLATQPGFTTKEKKILFSMFNQGIKYNELDEWYSRVRTRLLMGRDKFGASWLDRQIISYLQENGGGFVVTQ